MSYSQHDEEDVILSVLGERRGRFLDIGAHDGVTFSNTRRLAELGWSGVLVEPSPSPFCGLMDVYRECVNIVLVHAAICPEPGLLTFYDSRGDCISTFDDKHRDIWAQGNTSREGTKYQSIDVVGITIPMLLARHPGPYEFVNLDVEGLNPELFRALPLRDLGVELVCVEHQGAFEIVDGHALAQGFQRMHATDENFLYRRVS